MCEAYVGRFAPSPTGDLHFGSLVAALGSWLRARSLSGQWLIRIEDLDPPREVAGSAERIIETLTAFGMTSDAAIVVQSTRTDLYQAALDRLIAAGVAFPCACSRKQLEATSGLHLTDCAAPEPGSAYTWRARVPDLEIDFVDGLIGHYTQSLRREVGDLVLRRNDGLFAYQLAVVVDDAAQGISEVVRGADLLDSTPRQIWLQQVLNLPTPQYLHLPLVRDEHGRKLSKSSASHPVDAAQPLIALREALAVLGQRAQSDELAVYALLDAAVAAFDLELVPASVPSRTVAGSD